MRIDRISHTTSWTKKKASRMWNPRNQDFCWSRQKAGSEKKPDSVICQVNTHDKMLVLRKMTELEHWFWKAADWFIVSTENAKSLLDAEELLTDEAFWKALDWFVASRGHAQLQPQRRPEQSKTRNSSANRQRPSDMTPLRLRSEALNNSGIVKRSMDEGRDP
mgnify:CR=1 FL=1